MSDIHHHQQQAEDAARTLAMIALNVGCACRRCGQPFKAEKVKARFLAGLRVKCRLCGWYGVWRDQTVLAASSLNCRQFLVLWYRYRTGRQQYQVAHTVGVAQSTVHEWRERLEGGFGP